MENITDFTLSLEHLQFVGQDLARPECVLTQPDGTLWVSDKRGTATIIHPNGTQTLVGQSGGEPNGLALDRDGHLYSANMTDGKIYKWHPQDDQEQVVLDHLKGWPLGAANFVFIDSQDRLWVSIFTREKPHYKSTVNPRPDGYLICIDQDGPNVVADGILGANEVRLDAEEKYVYVAETMACRIIRFPILADGTLGKREVYGPDTLGQGAFVDGFAFDSAGNLWVVTVTRNGLGVITPNGDYHIVFEDVQEMAVDAVVSGVKNGTLTVDMSRACVGSTLQFPSSIAFGGPDLKTAYLGSLGMSSIATFQAPIAGLPLRHWVGK
ncbi:MAG: SMP-30/gluconolactonase/LRE family protein [Chloroflexota bacterium]